MTITIRRDKNNIKKRGGRRPTATAAPQHTQEAVRRKRGHGDKRERIHRTDGEGGERGRCARHEEPHCKERGGHACNSAEIKKINQKGQVWYDDGPYFLHFGRET